MAKGSFFAKVALGEGSQSDAIRTLGQCTKKNGADYFADLKRLGLNIFHGSGVSPGAVLLDRKFKYLPVRSHIEEFCADCDRG